MSPNPPGCPYSPSGAPNAAGRTRFSQSAALPLPNRLPAFPSPSPLRPSNNGRFRLSPALYGNALSSYSIHCPPCRDARSKYRAAVRLLPPVAANHRLRKAPNHPFPIGLYMLGCRQIVLASMIACEQDDGHILKEELV